MSEQDKASYTAAVLIIGNEILTGRTKDTNGQFLAENLNKKGITLREIRVVPDIEQEVIEALNALREKYDYVFTTGGIGPTHDDITAECIAKAFGVDLPLNENARHILLEYYGEEELTDARLKMARIPVGAKLIHNPVSAAPGFHIGNVYVMAGVPKIMQAMFDQIAGSLIGGQPVLSATVTCQLPESVLAPHLEKLLEQFGNIEIGSYPHYRDGQQGLSIVTRSTNQGLLDQATQSLFDVIKGLDGKPVLGNTASAA